MGGWGKAGAVVLTGVLVYSIGENQYHQYKVRKHVENLLTERVYAQEKKLSIDHPGVPELKIGLPRGYPEETLDGIVIAAYEDDKVYLHLFGYVRKRLRAIPYFSSMDEVQDTIDHELGHYYVDKHTTYNTIAVRNKAERIGFRMISEGIAEYFERTMNNKPDDFKESEWPKELDDFEKVRIMYEGGYHLVKPIIDAHGTRGMQYVLENYPKEKDLKNMPAYQKRILEELSTNPVVQSHEK